jgi:hypothetical protein
MVACSLPDMMRRWWTLQTTAVWSFLPGINTLGPHILVRALLRPVTRRDPLCLGIIPRNQRTRRTNFR